MIFAPAIIGIIIIAFIWWRYTSVARGARQRDNRLLRVVDPIAQKLSNKGQVTPEEVANLTRQPQFRPMVYQLLKHFGRLDLFPSEDLTVEALGAGVLAYWLMHPNELQGAPEEIELVEQVDRDLQGERGKFLAFRYRMPAGHWAAKDGWLLGLAGPFFDKDVPYCGVAAGFSRCGDKFGEVKPPDLIDWYIGVLTRMRA
jgi:hypothetical protein